MLSQEGKEVLLKVVALAFPDLLNEMLSTLGWLVEGVGITYGKILEGPKEFCKENLLDRMAKVVQTENTRGAWVWRSKVL